MLDTVLQIGKAFRNLLTCLKHHRYVKLCPQDTDKLKILRLSIPVRGNFTFDFDAIEEITDENVIRDKLFYFKFQTSDSDSSIKYVFGDIFYLRNTKNKEGGNYRTKTYSPYSAFERAEQYLQSLQNEKIKSFRLSFAREIGLIEKILLDNEAVFLHFNFKEGDNCWYAQTELEELNRLMFKCFAQEIHNKEVNGFVLETMLYKTLSSGNEKNDIQFPNFRDQQKYKSRFFSQTELQSLFYAIDYSETALLRVPNSNIKIIVLPKGENLSAGHYENFVDRTTFTDDLPAQENVIRAENIPEAEDRLFSPFVQNVANEIVQFDLILSKKGSVSAPDVDLIEVSGLEKSYLRYLHERITTIKLLLHDKRKEEIKAKLDPLQIYKSFLNVIGDSTKEKKKYQGHMYKVLPQIYSGTYYKDPILLPRFIEKTEENIRAGKQDFNFLKYDFYFLTLIQNTLKEGENLMNIKESKSYKIGLLLGELAQQFARWRDDCPIKSFEKSYVGTLSRRITTLAELIKFKTYIEEKLVLHERSSYTFKTSTQLAEAIKELGSSEEKYDRHKCAFGFFESYFASPENKSEKELKTSDN